MSLTLSTVLSSRPSLGRVPPAPRRPFSAIHLPRLDCRRNVQFSPKFTHSLFGSYSSKTRFLRIGCSGSPLEAENGESGGLDVDEAERLARSSSTMPDRFKFKEVPDDPVRWPYFVALIFLIYAWRAVLFELFNWRKTASAIAGFVTYPFKLVLALVFYIIGDPITSAIRFIETGIYTIRAFYSSIVTYAPVPELTVVIMMASAVLAIGEAVVPDAVNSQPYILSLSGLIGYAAVRGYISELFFWTVLIGIYGFSRVVKKRNDVVAALPVAAVMAAIGEPWVRAVAIISYLALAISHHSKKQLSEGKEAESGRKERRLPIPLLGAALAIGIRIAAKWAGYRHLTWMVV